MTLAKGVFTALATPFKQGEVDFTSLKRMIEFQTSVTGFVVAGTTGESPTVSVEEIHQIFEFVQQHKLADQQIIVGTGTNCTQSTLERTQLAKDWGADAALIVVPYYNKPDQEGLFQHYQFIKQNCPLDIIAYNVPSRTITSLSIETIKRLVEGNIIAALKDATGDMNYHNSLVSWRKETGKNFLLYSGDDGTYGSYLKGGGDGVISVASHIIPQQFMQWFQVGVDLDLSLCAKYDGLFQSLGIISNPIPLKMALKLMGQLESAELRLPLVELSEPLVSDLKEELISLGVLK